MMRQVSVLVSGTLAVFALSGLAEARPPPAHYCLIIQPASEASWRAEESAYFGINSVLGTAWPSATYWGVEGSYDAAAWAKRVAARPCSPGEPSIYLKMEPQNGGLGYRMGLRLEGAGSPLEFTVSRPDAAARGLAIGAQPVDALPPGPDLNALRARRASAADGRDLARALTAASGGS